MLENLQKNQDIQERGIREAINGNVRMVNMNMFVKFVERNILKLFESLHNYSLPK